MTFFLLNIHHDHTQGSSSAYFMSHIVKKGGLTYFQGGQDSDHLMNTVELQWLQAGSRSAIGRAPDS